MTDSIRSPLAHTHITFIGGGNMGRALIGGLLASGLQAKQMTVVEPFTATAEKLKSDFSLAIVHSIDQLQFDPTLEQLVVMAVKPQDFKQVALALAPPFKNCLCRTLTHHQHCSRYSALQYDKLVGSFTLCARNAKYPCPHRYGYYGFICRR